MDSNPNDLLVTIPEAAARMGMRERKARVALARNLIQPVRTKDGICVRLDDVIAVKRMRG